MAACFLVAETGLGFDHMSMSIAFMFSVCKLMGWCLLQIANFSDSSRAVLQVQLSVHDNIRVLRL